MTQAQFATRRERAESNIWIISKTEEGFRVYSPAAPTRWYMVRGIPEAPTCSCPDFQAYKADPEWQCKHILAVLNNGLQDQAEPETDPERTAERAAIQAEAGAPVPFRKPTRRHAQGGNGAPTAQMMIKRSVSPDGRIDSVSVEFAIPLNGESANEIKARALRTLQLQNDIAASFLKPNGNGNGVHQRVPEAPNSESGPSSPNGQPLFARLMDIGSANGRYGERLFISVSANGKRLRLYGTQKQLATYIGYAGEPINPSQLAPGMRLNIPCRVILTEGENGYCNVTRVLRLAQPRANGGRQWQPAQS